MFDENFVEMQLKCFSIVEYKALMEQGYPNRAEIDRFLKMYDIKSLQQEYQVSSLRQQRKVFQLEMLIRSIGLCKDTYRLGSSRICFRLLKTDILHKVLEPDNDQVIKVKTIYEKKINSLRRWKQMKEALSLVNVDADTIQQKCSIVTQKVDHQKVMNVNEKSNVKKREESIVGPSKRASIKTLKVSTKTTRQREMKPATEIRYDGMNHFPAIIHNPNRTRCKMEGCSLRTNHYCIKCNVHLCIKEEEKNCFLAYHTPPVLFQK